jgi:hypothetical protein
MTRASWPSPRDEWERQSVAEALFGEHPERLTRVVVALLRLLSSGPIASQRKLRQGVRRMLGHCSDGDVDAAVALLGPCVRRTCGARGATTYAVNFHALPPELRALFASESR